MFIVAFFLIVTSNASSLHKVMEWQLERDLFDSAKRQLTCGDDLDEKDIVKLQLSTCKCRQCLAVLAMELKAHVTVWHPSFASVRVFLWMKGFTSRNPKSKSCEWFLSAVNSGVILCIHWLQVPALLFQRWNPTAVVCLIAPIEICGRTPKLHAQTSLLPALTKRLSVKKIEAQIEKAIKRWGYNYSKR